MRSTHKLDSSEERAEFAGELRNVEPIRLIEPLARTLGAFEGEGDVVEYSYVDVIKLAGHPCPTTAAAYECCRAALARLYPGEVPIRGEIEVTVFGEADDGVYGVFGMVFGLITGAETEAGFKGLNTLFRRKDLLKYNPDLAPDSQGIWARFARADGGKAVLCRIDPVRKPSLPPHDARRLGALVQKVLWNAAGKDEVREFRLLWRQSVIAVLEDAKKDNQWLAVEEEK